MHGGSGVKALCQILSDESLSYSLKHISTGGTHFTFHGGALIPYIYISYFQDDVNMEICSALLALCAGNSPVTGEFPSQMPVTLSFDVFFDLCLTKRLSKQSRRRWFETPSRSSWRHCNVVPNSEPGSRGIFWRSTLVPIIGTLFQQISDSRR